MIALGVVQQQAQESGYRLDDDGTLAAQFEYERLPLDSTNLYADYTYTGTSRNLVALPRDITQAPGIVPLVDGETRVCGMYLSGMTPGVIPEFYLQMHNVDGSPDQILFNAKVKPDDGLESGTIKLEHGTFPGSMTTASTFYDGPFDGQVIALALTYDAGEVTCTLWVDGQPIVTSPAYETSGHVFADMLVNDEDGASGSIQIELTPSVPILSVNYGIFPAPAVDMDGTPTLES